MTDATEEVLALEKRRCAATLAGDLAALAEVLADDYMHVTGTGSWMSKQGYLDWVAKLPRDHRRGELKVRLYGDVAVINGDLLNRLGAIGSERLVDTYVTQVARKQDGRWQFVSFHITPKQTIKE